MRRSSHRFADDLFQNFKVSLQRGVSSNKERVGKAMEDVYSEIGIFMSKMRANSAMCFSLIVILIPIQYLLIVSFSLSPTETIKKM